MKFVGITCVLLASMPLSYGASKEIIELQRDVAQLQDQVRNLQKTLDQLTVLVQQTFNSGDKTNTALAIMQNNLNDAIKHQQETVVAPILGLGTKVDSMSEDFRNLKETVNDLSNRMGKLDSKVTDLQNTINVIKTGPAAPPPSTNPQSPVPGGLGSSPVPGGSQPLGSSAAPPPDMKSGTLYSNAYRDYLGGNYDIAQQEFSDYIRYFNDTEFAPNSQFYVGMIYYKKQDYSNALQAFDAVLEHYSDNPKTGDAHYWKGKTLLAMGKRDAAAKEFREVVSKYSSSDAAPQAKQELRNLGLSSGPARRRRR